MSSFHETSEKSNRWERRKERTRKRLLEAGDRYLRERGFDETTVEEIAEAADVAKGTFFNYFESKEALLLALLTHRIALAVETPLDGNLPVPERIRLTLYQVAEALAPYRHLTRHVLSRNLSRPHPPPRGLMDRIAGLIAEGQSEGLFRTEADAEVAAVFITLHFFRVSLLAALCGGQVEESWEAQLERGLDLVYHGLNRC